MNITTPEQDILEILYTEEDISRKVTELANTLTEEYKDKKPVLVCVLKGAAYFCIDLCRSMHCHLDMDFISVSSYGANSRSSGIVRLVKDLDTDINNRHVILVEDIIDSGLTLKYLNTLFSSRHPASIRTVSFLKKEIPGKPAACDVDNYGFVVPDGFVVGYGLDYAGYYRNLPYIGILKPQCYKE